MKLEIMLFSLAMNALHPHGVSIPQLAEALVESDATWEEATWLVAIGDRESGYRLNAVGDGGRSRCAYQLQQAPASVLQDAKLCTRYALHALRASMRLCPTEPLAAYAGAKCHSDTAKRITADRDRRRRLAFRKALGMTL